MMNMPHGFGDRVISEDEANAIYGILVEEGGASERERQMFVWYVAKPTSFGIEHRFMGRLGFGGKFHADMRGRNWHVGCYPEHLNDETRAIIDRANAKLSELEKQGDGR